MFTRPSYLNGNLATSVAGTNTMKRPDAQKLWESLRDQDTLFGLRSPDEEKRDFRFAKIGLLVAGIFLTLAATVELVFLADLLWQLLK